MALVAPGAPLAAHRPLETHLMNDPKQTRTPPMGEPAKHPEGASVGGMSQTADGGLADASQRSMEHRDETRPTGTGPAKAAAKPAATTPASAGKSPNDASWNDDEGENWRHAPIAPKDAGVLDSLGRSISEAVTGSEADTSGNKVKPPGRA